MTGTISITEYDMGQPTLIEWTGQITSQQLNEAMAIARERSPGIGIRMRGTGTAVLNGDGTEAYAITIPRQAKTVAIAPPPERPWKRPQNRAERRAAGKRRREV